MILLDLSIPLDAGMPLYPGDAPPKLKRLSEIADGCLLTASELTIGCHTGTHVDAPAHFLADGATVDALPLESFCGPAWVVNLEGIDVVSADDIEGAGPIPRRHHVLLRTRNSALLAATRFAEDYCCVSREAVEYLAGLDSLSIGFDYYSLDPYTTTEFPAHRAAARHALPVFVCLNLSAAPPGACQFSALPLAVKGAEGMPVRALLFKP